LNKNDITKIVIRNSANTAKYEIIDNKQKISEFIKSANSDVVKPKNENRISNGSITSVYFYTHSKNPAIIVFSGIVGFSTNGRYYKIIKGDLSNQIGNLYNKLP